ncbi:MAG TPA: 3-hydroxyacyl-CoA dehydrogenase NAD-binding domain-containing protein [Propionibacteriaceae bacterium]|nr:3-hydroxyacyl-CoA dehydrogenase NAD-binding domain-containing protein [Propionibacteriaceae bacterium]
MNTLTKAQLDGLLAQATALDDSDVVTSALSRDVRLPYADATAVLITLDNGRDHTKPTILGPRALASLNAALDAAMARDDVAALAITGKPFILAAGADLTLVPRITDRQQALAIARIGHAVLDKLHSAPFPSFAFLNGLALGGGLEVALHCDYRSVSTAAAGLGLPECFLGMVPGWGGAYLLPNLVGADGAVQVIIENALSQNRMLSPRDAVTLGIADLVLDSADFLERSLDWAGQIVAGSATVDRRPVDRGPAWDAAVARGRAFADQKVAGAAPGPYRALNLIGAARTADRVQAFAAEDEALADLLMSPELRAGLYAFDLVQRRAKRPAGAPDRALARPVTRVGIVGAGLMASQLALLFARHIEVPVVMSDLDAERVRRGVDSVRTKIDSLLERSRISPDQANRWKGLVTGTTDTADFAGCDFVLEAVFEDLQVKQKVFTAVENHVSETCLLATNTSSLSVSAIADVLRRPERMIGFHFFNPVSVLQLVEVIRGKATDDPALASALALAAKLRKKPVLVRDAPAFVVNRVQTRLLGEVLHAVDEGTPVEVADVALQPLGLPMSPFTLISLVGPAVALHVADTLHEAFGSRFPVSDNLRAMVAAHRPGIYDQAADGTPYVSARTRQLLRTGDRPSTAEEVRARALAAVAEEISLMLSEEVVSTPMDIDLCMILGGGWPFHLGGITPYLDREGISERVVGRRFLPPGVASVASTP